MSLQRRSIFESRFSFQCKCSQKRSISNRSINQSINHSKSKRKKMRCPFTGNVQRTHLIFFVWPSINDLLNWNFRCNWDRYKSIPLGRALEFSGRMAGRFQIAKLTCDPFLSFIIKELGKTFEFSGRGPGRFWSVISFSWTFMYKKRHHTLKSARSAAGKFDAVSQFGKNTKQMTCFLSCQTSRDGQSC